MPNSSAISSSTNSPCSEESQRVGEDLDAIFDEDLEASVVEIHRTIERISAEHARRIAEVDRRELHRTLRHPSTASWLADRCRLSWSQERGLVATASALSEIPLTAVCYANGDIDTGRVRYLVAAHQAHPEAYTVKRESSSMSPARSRRANSAARSRSGGRISTTQRRLACDAIITRIVTGPGSRPLDVGRATRSIPSAIRRALVARDRGCRWKGCDRPSRWSNAHHVVHRDDGEVTAIYNLILLCRYHLRWVHERLDRGPPHRDLAELIT